jgi:hypothetical protein
MSYNVVMRNLVLGVVIIGLSFLALAKPVFAEVEFRTGDILDARNATAGEANWAKTVQAKVLDEIEFRVFVDNIGSSDSPDVNVRAGFALDSGSVLKNRIFVGVWSAPQAVGTIEVKVDDDIEQKLVYVPGKAVKFGGGCDGCSVSDNIAKANGAYIGKVKAGEKVEVRFRAQVTQSRSGPVAGIGGTSTPTPTPTSGSGSGSGGVGGAAVAGTTPKTGFTDPYQLRTLMWLGVGFAGFGLRQISRRMSKIKV